MADQTTESVILELRLNSEQYKQEQKLIRESLAQLVLGIEKTKQAQKDLDTARKAGKLTDEAYSRQSVLLREELKGQQDDYRNLSKGLENSQKVMNAGAGSIVQLRARLSELTEAYNNLSQAERDNSDEGKSLQAEARAVSEELKKQEGLIGDNRRNVGGYAAAYKQSFGALVAELAKVTAAQKQVDAASEQGQRLQQQRIGFMTAAQKAAAQAGVTDFSQAQATIEQYSQALGPAAENLVRLQQEQQQIGQTAGETSEQYQALGFKIAGAEKSLADLVSAQEAAAQAARNGGAAAQGQAAQAEVAAGSLAAMRRELEQLQNTRETLDPTTKEAQELNTQILELRTNIQQAEGKIDEFGERVQKNIRKENFDTVSDAIQGLAGATAVATLVFGENSDAAAAQAKALQLMTIAQNARAIAIGLDSAKDATQIVLLKAKSLFLKEEATLTAAAAVSTEAHAAVAGADAAATEAQAAAAAINAEAQATGAEATVASTVATEAQVVATEGATVAQRALNLALKLNPIGLVIIAVAALVSLLAVYRNSSEATQQKIRNITEAFLRFSNPIGLVYTGIEKLYQQFELVRKVLDPLIAGFNRVAGVVVQNARAFGEYIGLLDTAAEKAAKLAAAELERANALREQADAEIALLAATGASAREISQQKIAAIEDQLKAAVNADQKQQALHEKDLKRINAQLEANKKLSESERKPLAESDNKILAEVEKASQLVTTLRTQQQAAIAEAVERDRAARQQEAQDIETNAARASQNLQRRLAQQQAAEQAAAQRRLSYLDLQLSAVQKGTEQELALQQKKVQAQAALEISQARLTLANQQHLRAQYLPAQLAALGQEREQALQQTNLTEQQRNEIVADYAQKRIDLEQQYSLAAARQEVARIPLIRQQANAASLKLVEDYNRQVNALALQSQAEQNRALLLSTQEGSTARLALENTLINQEEQLAITALDRRAMSTLEYETKVMAIRTDAAAKRKALDDQQSQQLAGLFQDQQRSEELAQQALLAGHSEARQTELRATEQYHQSLLRAELDNYSAQLQATKEGTTARENVEKQHALNLQAIEQDTARARVQVVAEQYQQFAQAASQAISAIATFQDAAGQQQLDRIKKEESAATTSAARKAVLAKQEERLSQQLHEKQQKFALAQAVIDGGSAVMRILADTPKGDFGIATAIQIALAAFTTAAQIRTIASQKFEQGGVLRGRTHAQGGIPLFSRNTGLPLGAEAEDEEIILTKGVFRNPRLRAAASALNVAGGGRAFYTDPLPSSTWARFAQGGVVSSSAMYLPQVRTGGVVQQPAADIDYDLLTDMMAAKLGPAFGDAARELPAPNLNLTELRDRNQQLDKQQAQTDI